MMSPRSCNPKAHQRPDVTAGKKQQNGSQGEQRAQFQLPKPQDGKQSGKSEQGEQNIADDEGGLTGNIVFKSQPQIVKHDVDQIPDTKTQREQVFTVAAVPYLGQDSIHGRVLLCFLCDVLC